nr:MAG TPA: hypothetical protein [Caudoviricetes sp.]
MNAADRRKFLASPEWKAFRLTKQITQPTDEITGAKLYRGWNLHHLDLNSEHYDQLDPSHFACLNVKSHEVIHAIWRQDRQRLAWKDRKID